jgi:hypothetical protein
MRYPPCLLLLALILLVSAASAYPIYVAAGDPASVHENVPGGSCWLFPSSGVGYEYDFSPATTGNETFCTIPGKTTANLIPGTYTMIYQEPVVVGNKIFKDVSWVDNSLVSSFAKVKPVDESGKQAPAVMNDLKRLVETNQFNTLKTDQVFIEKPDLKLNTLQQTAENVYTASGTSNFADGTPVTIKIDDARYYSQHNDTFVYHTKVIRESSEASGSWSVNMLMPIQEMPPGWHEIAIYSRELSTTSQFRIYEQEWGPAPTPTQYIKYLSDGNIAPVYVTVIQEKIVDHYTDRWHTATPTPAITDALGGTVDYPYKTGGQIPGWVALIALLCIAGIVIARDWTWK